MNEWSYTCSVPARFRSVDWHLFDVLSLSFDND